MPCDLRRYGPGWRDFSKGIRFFRAGGRCECSGQCGKHHTHRCDELHGHPGRAMRGTVRLTTAHLCACDPPCQQAPHVIAACQACHLRIDIALHLRNRRLSAKAKLHRSQMLLPGVLDSPPCNGETPKP